MSSSPASERDWEDLRREARKLESEVDVKLAGFSKFGQGFGDTSSLGSGAGGSTIKSGDQLVEQKAAEIEALLMQLQRLNDSMSSAVSGSGTARMHTVARHRDILIEFTQEFRRTRSVITAGIEKESLLGGRVNASSSPHIGLDIHPGNSSSSNLLRERNAINNSNIGIDSVISQAAGDNVCAVIPTGPFRGDGGQTLTTGLALPAGEHNAHSHTSETVAGHVDLSVRDRCLYALHPNLLA
eukprot:CAMPEP_0118940428 /NCGR_PEP_ID=MMETSP1169-20130426/31405_1 /TAXON_ID=36882 /ORGANISM="Pyramimonas obovata, Strain CCMP722" /LENGTH=240 /DNA_ID=CAMNT_0006884907 /DNA_START=157 /DNA_END=878 /DNA_ORIENTATION=+